MTAWRLARGLPLAALVGFAGATALAGTAAVPVWRVRAVEPRVLLVQADFTPVERAAFSPSLLSRLKGGWKNLWTWDRETKAAQSGRPARERQLREMSRWKVDGCELEGLGYWKSPVGEARFPDGAKGPLRPVRGVETVYQVFLRLDRPLPDGCRADVVTPTGERLPFTYREDAPSPFFKVNQAGYAIQASRRYAYLGGWLGTAGAWQPPPAGTAFEVVDGKGGGTVLRGRLAERPRDLPTPEGRPWTGERTMEIDLSPLSTPGRYFIRVPGTGRSEEFDLSADGLHAAFAVHMHGLFAQRCGSPQKKEPFTHWADRPCHVKVRRGIFPPDIADYAGDPDRASGFTDAAGKPVRAEPFDIIARNAAAGAETLELPGGWHDAADYDRRPFHLGVVTDLAAAFMVRPKNFRDGGLNVPEKGNGIPDVLDEAAWGLEHLRRGQTADGGVGTWIETTGHPVEGQGMPGDDRAVYWMSRPTRASTLEYCAAAAMLARLDPRLKERLLDSAVRAWRYAHEAAVATNVPFRAQIDGREKTVFWHDSSVRPPHVLLKAALGLAAATGDRSWLAETGTPEFRKALVFAFYKSGWTWRPFYLAELFGDEGTEYGDLRRLLEDKMRKTSDEWIGWMEAQPYRTPWIPPALHAGADGMPWGACHPLVRAQTFVAAHMLTGDRKYLDAAYLANDFHCGCNPEGATLTSGLGRVYPVTFLHLQSAADDVAEYAAGITPYRWTGTPGRADVEYVHTQAESDSWPVWRIRPSSETLDVPACEFTVSETIGPAAAVTGYLMGSVGGGAEPLTLPPPARALRDLPGHWALP